MIRCGVIFLFAFLINELNCISSNDSDVDLDSYQFIAKYGYQPEKRVVETEDGYLVTLFRLVGKGPPVLLAHGLADSSDSWLVLGPTMSLAYQLSDAGFDVWLYNSRGNRYSKGNTKRYTNKEYWDFTYEEMGTRDLPACIDHILKVTSREKISYVGFSQGTTIFFVMCSVKPEYNKKINHAVLLAPVAWTNSIEYPFISYLGRYLKFLIVLFDHFGIHEMFTENMRRKQQGIECYKTSSYCDLEYYLNFGVANFENLALDKIDVIDSHIPAGASTKTLAHFIQGYRNKQFQRFDYGLRKNLLLYSSIQPPDYDVSKVTVPLSLFVSESDRLSDISDVKILVPKLRNIKRYFEFNRTLDFTHIEFAYGRRVNEYINYPTLKILLEEIKNSDET
ncbi:lipase 1-like [Plodia interpunctella]|uniref:lipase 1-like n=1 Tax=Plodia interpunctella TaxID=58824 RepID=UPI002367A5D1|nr:lipase 1-like [Plodia interpunctella]